MTELRIKIDEESEVVFYYGDREFKGYFHPILKAKINGVLCNEQWSFIQIIENESTNGEIIRFLDSMQPQDGYFSPFYATSSEWGGCDSPFNYHDEPVNNLLQPGKVRFYTIFCTYKDDTDSNGSLKGRACKALAGVKWGFGRSGSRPADKDILPISEISPTEKWNMIRFLEENYTEERFSFIL